LWSLSISRGSRSNRDQLLETFLLEEHRHGLASKECHARYPLAYTCRTPHLFTRLTALFLATKTTNNPISLEAYTAHIPKTAPSDVLDLEFLVAQSLGFEFAIWHSHRALWGICLDVHVCCPQLFYPTSGADRWARQNLPDCPTDTKPLYEAALGHIRASRLTDAELIYTPSQIALAAFSLVAPNLAQQWLTTKTSSESSSLSLNNLLSLAEKIKLLITLHGHSPDIEAVREVDRRLKLCKNPEKVVGSQAYLAKMADEEKKAENKRQKKADELHRTMTDGDPFGNELVARPGLVNYEDEDD